MTMQEALDSQGHDEPAKPPVCSTCNDTHWMPFSGEVAPCTRCPVPCQKCRVGGNGPYCTTTPCGCACHCAKPAKVEPPKLDRHPCPLCSHWLGNHKTADDFWICVDCKYRWKVEAARPDRAAIQARAEAATPEPWDAKETGELLPDGHRALLSVIGSHGLCIVLSVPVEADADFIAHAREDIPALLDEVARLESALKGWIGDAERLQREVAQLTRERDAAYSDGLQKGFEVAESEAWISTWDGWHVTNPRIDWEAAQKALEKAKAEVKP